MLDSGERRYAVRVNTPGGEAFCHVDGYGDRYLMTDFSTRGVRLRCGPMLPIGKEIEIVIFAGGIGMISLRGRVLRELPDGVSMAVTFDRPNHESSQRLEDLVATAFVHDFWPSHP
ncbi:MAG: PilZ domain-containing protein [Deltaproteobacteria bacterium]|nr:PilZ domain-containing protein [Deltaproteobacteria bacterium]